VAAPEHGALYVDVVNAMLRLACADGRPAAYGNAIVQRFLVREVVQAPLLAEPGHDGRMLAPGVQDAPGALQDRRTCCGTMNLAEYHNVQRLLDGELAALGRWCALHGRAGLAAPQADEGAPDATDSATDTI